MYRGKLQEGIEMIQYHQETIFIEERGMSNERYESEVSDEMSRIPPLPESSLAQFPSEMLSASVSNMSTLFRVMGHRPQLMRPAIELLEAAMRGGTVEPQLKELVAVRVSQVNHCSY